MWLLNHTFQTPILKACCEETYVQDRHSIIFTSLCCSHKHGLHFILLDRLFFQPYNTTGPHLQYLSKIQDWGRQRGVLRLWEEILQRLLECLWHNFLLTIKQNDKQLASSERIRKHKTINSQLSSTWIELLSWQLCWTWTNESFKSQWFS